MFKKKKLILNPTLSSMSSFDAYKCHLLVHFFAYRCHCNQQTFVISANHMSAFSQKVPVESFFQKLVWLKNSGISHLNKTHCALIGHPVLPLLCSHILRDFQMCCGTALRWGKGGPLQKVWMEANLLSFFSSYWCLSPLAHARACVWRFVPLLLGG